MSNNRNSNTANGMIVNPIADALLSRAPENDAALNVAASALGDAAGRAALSEMDTHRSLHVDSAATHPQALADRAIAHNTDDLLHSSPHSHVAFDGVVVRHAFDSDATQGDAGDTSAQIWTPQYTALESHGAGQFGDPLSLHDALTGYHSNGAPPPSAVITGQLWEADAGTTSGNPDGHSDVRLEHDDSDDVASDQIDEHDFTSAGALNSVGLDTAADLWFTVDNNDVLHVGHISTGAEIGTGTTIASTSDQDLVWSMIVDPRTDTIYEELFGGDYTQVDAGEGGRQRGGEIIKITYNPSTGAITNDPYNSVTFANNTNDILADSGSSNNKIALVRSMALNASGSTMYLVDDNDADPGSYWGFKTNAIYSMSTSGSVGTGDAPTPTLLTDVTQFNTTTNGGGSYTTPYIVALAVNNAQGIIYFATDATGEGVNTSEDAIWWMPIAGGTANKMTMPSGVTLDFNAFFSSGLTFDPAGRQLYVSDVQRDAIIQLTLDSLGHSFTSGVNTFRTVDTNGDGAFTSSLFWDSLPVLGNIVGTSTEAVQGGGTLTLLTGAPTISDPDGSGLNMGFAKIVIANAQSGDQLFVNGVQSGTVLGVSVSWNSSTHTLTLTGDASEATYQTLFAEISYQDAGTDNSSGSHPTRTIDWIISDGITVADQTTADSNEKATTVVIDRAPTVVTDNYAVLETATSTGTSGTGGTGVFHNDSDLDGDSFTVTAVAGSGVNVGNSIAGTYGHLTLNANGSYSYIADNTAAIDNASNGSHPVDSYTYTVSDGLGGVSTTTVTFTIDRPPTVVADSPATNAVESGAALTGNVLTNDSDKDGDSLTVSAVAGGSVGGSVAGTYGHMTINSDGSYSYLADNTAAIDGAGTGSHLTDTFTYTASDGHGGTTSTTITVIIDRPPTVVADSPATNVVESGSALTGNVLTNDSDRDGDSLTVSAVTGGSVGGSVAGTYGHMTINSDGSYSYVADNTAAIDGAGTGSHLTDTFTYTASDGHGGTTSTTITVIIDRPPTVVNDTAGTVAEGGNASANAAAGVLTNDSDRDGDSLTVSALSGGSVGVSSATTYGHITLNADGSYSYAADNTTAIDAAATGSHPVDIVNFTVSDGAGGFTNETLSFTIDRPATGTADAIATFENAVAQNGVGGNANVLANDVDKDGDAITIIAVNGNASYVGTQITLASGALLTLNANGTYTYDPNHAFDYLPGASSGASNTATTDTFTYTIDGGATVTVTVTITGVDSNDTLIGTGGNDTLHGGVGDDIIRPLGGTDAVFGDSGNDYIVMNGNLTAADQIDGGTGNDTLSLKGDYSAGVIFTATTVLNIEDIGLAAGFSYNLTMADATVAAGNTLTIKGDALGVGDSLIFDGSADVTGGNFIIYGGAGNDALTGGHGNDTIISNGGTDIVHGGGGDDYIVMNANLTSADQIDGGTGTDVLSLKGNYSAGVTFNATTVTNIEDIGLAAGFSYKLVVADATVGFGNTLTINGSGLGAGDSLIFDGSADVTGGNFVIYGGAGNDTLTGGYGDDTIKAGGGTDIVRGGGGDDYIVMTSNLTAADQIDGGTGNDTLSLKGDYSAGVTFNATTVTNIEDIGLAAGFSYNLTIADATVAAGNTLTIKGGALGAGDSLIFDGSADVTGGNLIIYGGAGNDTLTGGHGNDTIRAGNGTNTITGGGGSDILVGGSGADQFVYNGVSDSTSATYDQVRGFDTLSDTFKFVGTTVNAIDTEVASGHLGTANFDGNLASAIGAGQLAAHDAVLFTPDSGTLSGHTFLIVDVNGVAGYQAGQDYVIDITGATHLGSLSTADFVS